MPVRSIPPVRFSEVRDDIALVDEAVARKDGHPALGDAVWRDLTDPGPDSAGFLDDERGYVHVARSDTFASPHWAIGAAIHPSARAGSTRARLLRAALGHVAVHGGGRAVLWVFEPGADDDAELAGLGFHPDRDLLEMRALLPVGEQPVWPPGVTVRTFQPGRDERAWLAVNNRAFRNHPEQGGWVEATLDRRLAEPWFDPTLFLLAFDEQGLAGFNWLKLHGRDGAGPERGEIFVIGVDPRAHGTGLGRALALAGLDTVARRGVRTGSLFVAADNEAALRLYRSLGFRVHRTDRAYACEVAPA